MRCRFPIAPAVELFAGGDVATPGSFRGPLQCSGRAGWSDELRSARLRRRLSPRLHGRRGVRLQRSIRTCRHSRALRIRSSTARIARSAVISPTADGPRAHQRAASATRTRASSTSARGIPSRPARNGGRSSALRSARRGCRHIRYAGARATTSTRVELGKADTVFQQRVETGLQYSPMRNFELRLTAAASHVDGGDGSERSRISALLGLDSAQSRRARPLGIPRRARRRLALLSGCSGSVPFC